MPEGGALLLAAAHQLLDLLQLDRRDDRAHVHCLVEGIAYAERLHSCLELSHQPLRHSLLHQNARARAAHLALVEPDRVHHAFDHAVEIGI